VLDLFTRGGLEGWRVRSVFVAGSDLHGEYREAWANLAAMVGGSARSSFEGGR